VARGWEYNSRLAVERLAEYRLVQRPENSVQLSVGDSHGKFVFEEELEVGL
jgi:hypothetical protein